MAGGRQLVKTSYFLFLPILNTENVACGFGSFGVV